VGACFNVLERGRRRAGTKLINNIHFSMHGRRVVDFVSKSSQRSRATCGRLIISPRSHSAVGVTPSDIGHKWLEEVSRSKSRITETHDRSSPGQDSNRFASAMGDLQSGGEAPSPTELRE
jgi:hypothetical protein